MLSMKNAPFLLKTLKTQNLYQAGNGFKLLNTTCCANNKTDSVESKVKHPINIKTFDRDPNELHCTPEEWSNAKPFKDIPGPKPLPILGNTWRFIPGIGEYGSFTSNLYGFFEIMYNTFGEIVRIEKILGLPNGVQLYNPAEIEKVYKLEGIMPERDILPSLSYFRKNMRQDLFKNARGLLTSQGEDWYVFRNKVNAIMMQPKVIKQYISPIDNIAKEFVERIKSVRNEDNKISVDFWKELNKWALESTTYLALNRKLGCLKGDLPEDSTPAKMIRIAEDVFTYAAKLDFEPSPWKYITTPTYIKTMKIYNEQTTMSEALIKQAMKEISERKKEINANEESSEPSVLEKLLKIDEKIAIVMTLDMLLAGVDTTSTALLNILYYLAINKPKQEILRKELIQFFSNDNIVLTTETLNSMPYLKACIKEAARLYPVTPGTMRVLTKDAVLLGYQVPKGTEIMFPHMYMSVDEKQFPKVNEYIPERWLRNNEDSELSYKKAHPFCSMPFGFGSRSCIGRRFAELELEVAVINFIRNFNISWKGPPPRQAITSINYLLGPYHFIFEDANK